MNIKRTSLLSLSLALLTIACKEPGSSSGAGGADGSTQSTSMTQTDVQEFYEIVKEFYLKRAKTMEFTADDRYETNFIKKFGIPLNANNRIEELASNMFDFMESGKYGMVLYGIPRKAQVAGQPPAGMTSRDLEDFLQIIKTEYYKFITGVQLQNFGAREIRFYARMQGLPPTAMPKQGDLLIIAADLFNKIETGR